MGIKRAPIENFAKRGDPSTWVPSTFPYRLARVNLEEKWGLSEISSIGFRAQTHPACSNKSERFTKYLLAVISFFWRSCSHLVGRSERKFKHKCVGMDDAVGMISEEAMFTRHAHAGHISIVGRGRIPLHAPHENAGEVVRSRILC